MASRSVEGGPYDRPVPTDRRWDADTALLQEAYTSAGLIAALVGEELRAADVPPSLFSLLAWISLLEPVTPSRLRAETGIPTTTLRDYIRTLVDRGDVRRIANPDDGRSYQLVLTSAGRRLVDRGRPAVARAHRGLRAHLPRSEKEFGAFARELRRALQEALAGEPAPVLIGAPQQRRRQSSEVGILPTAIRLRGGVLLVAQGRPVPAIRRVNLASGVVTTLAR